MEAYDKYWDLFRGTGDPIAYMLYRAMPDTEADGLSGWRDSGTQTETGGRFSGGGILLQETAFS